LLLTGNALHSDVGIDATPSGFLGWLLTCLGQQHGFPVPEGGAGRLTDALVRRLESRGGAVECNRPVTGVVVRDGRAVAVRFADGSELAARRAVVADVGAPALYRELVGEEHLPPSVMRELDRFQYDHATFKIDWALSGPIPWRAEGAQRAGTVHVCESMDLATAYTADLACDRIPDRPFVLVGQMNKADPTRSPAGTETVWAYTHVPRQPRADARPHERGGGVTGKWDAADVERFAARVEDEIEAQAPGFRSLVTARHVLTPPSLEEHDTNLVGGALGGGTMALWQQLVFRPVSGLGRAETPIRGLFLGSASAHPGGGVHGACGANAARAAIAADRVRRALRRLGR
jgi:phytoene dehydrogenase-like protein